MLADVTHQTTLAIEAQVVVRLLAAAALGAAVGYDREATDQPAGLRTHVALAVGAALFGIVSTVGYDEYTNEVGTTLSVDPTRVASNVATGIGFLGAGVIFRRGNSVRNLTTAASLWAVGAVGLACGLGDLGTAVLGTAILLVSLVLLRPLRAVIRGAGAGHFPVRATLGRGVAPEPVLDRFTSQPGVEAKDVMLLKEAGHLVLACTVSGDRVAVQRWMWAVASLEGVDSLSEG